MGHGDGFIGVTGPHVIDDHSGGVETRCVADFLSVCAVAFSYERYPGPVCRLRCGEPGAGVAGLSVMAGQRDEHRAPGLSLGRVLAVAAALCLLRLQLGSGRVLVADVHECGVPLLLLGHGEVQTQQVHETEGQQPGGESQTPARFTHRHGHVYRCTVPVSVSPRPAHLSRLANRAHLVSLPVPEIAK